MRPGSSAFPSVVPGAVLDGRYRIDGVIGEGGFAAVFRATQLNLARPVAVKVLHPDVLERDGLLRFQREAEMVQRLCHPNTVRLLDFGSVSKESPYLVFELLSGTTLESAIAKGPLSVARVARIASQILKALMEAHALGIVHRDIKPANIFLCRFEGDADFVKLLDFGIAKSNDSRPLTQTGHMVGTAAYISPEQVASRPATFATDLYSLGLVMSEALSGRAVYADLSLVEIVREHLSDASVPHAAVVSSSSLGSIVQRATLKDPERRYGSAADMLAHVEAVIRAGAAPHSAFVQLPAARVGGGSPSPENVSLPMFLGPQAERVAPKPKGRGTPWALLGILGGTAAVGGVTLALALGLGFGSDAGRGTKGGGLGPTPTSGSRAPAPFDPSRGGGEGISLNFIQAHNDDDIPEGRVKGTAQDFLALMEEPNHEGGEGKVRLCAFDGASFRSLWCTGVVYTRAAVNFVHVALTSRAAVYIDAGARVHLFDLTTGKETTTLAMASRTHNTCLPRDNPATLWMATEDQHGFALDTATRTITPAPEWPASCPRGTVRRTTCPDGGKDKLCPPSFPHPTSEVGGLSIHGSRDDGIDGVTIGKREPTGTEVVFGFTPGRKITRRWEHPLAPSGAIDVSRLTIDRGGLPAVVNGRALVSYSDATGGHLVMLDAKQGNVLWNAPVNGLLRSVKMTASRIYLYRYDSLEVLNVANGASLGILGK